MANTGRLIYRRLEQYNSVTGEATGVVKDNVEGTEGYIPPVEDLDQCPVEGQTDPAPEPLNVTPTSLYNTPGFGGPTDTAYVETNGSWVAESLSSWLTFAGEMTRTGFGNEHIGATANPNPSTTYPRTGYFNVSNGTYTIQVSVEQDPNTSGSGGSGGGGGGDTGDEPDEPIPYDPNNPY